MGAPNFRTTLEPAHRIPEPPAGTPEPRTSRVVGPELRSGLNNATMLL